MEKQIAVLSGDGIGPEVMEQALRVLQAVSKKFGHSFELAQGLVGGAAYDKHGSHFPDETRRLCEASDAVLFGSVGGPVSEQSKPKWKNCEANSILSIRKTFQLNANFRPAVVYPELVEISPLKNSLIEQGVDMLILRELVGDIYFGEHKTEIVNGKRQAHDVAEYNEDQIAAIGHIAFQAAQKRRKKLTSVDKANVLDVSKLWREVMHEVRAQYPDVEYEDMLVDNAAMQIIRAPFKFDVVVTGNMFGDILSDAAAVLPGSLGLMPSASLNKEGFGLYEPSGGSAPDIAGQGVANPIAQILSVAMLLKFSFGLLKESSAIEGAVQVAIKSGLRTQDIFGPGTTKVGTKEMTDRIVAALVA